MINALFGLALLVSQFAFRKPLIKQMLAKEIQVPDSVWGRVNLAWALFFLVRNNFV